MSILTPLEHNGNRREVSPCVSFSIQIRVGIQSATGLSGCVTCYIFGKAPQGKLGIDFWYDGFVIFIFLMMFFTLSFGDTLYHIGNISGLKWTARIMYAIYFTEILFSNPKRKVNRIANLSTSISRAVAPWADDNRRVSGVNLAAIISAKWTLRLTNEAGIYEIEVKDDDGGGYIYCVCFRVFSGVLLALSKHVGGQDSCWCAAGVVRESPC